VIVREFRVKAGCEKDFALVFGPEGIWATLLETRSQGFVRTELQAQSVEYLGFRVLDYWQSHWDFETFRASCQDDLDQFRQWLASKDLVEHEALVAAFYTDSSGEGDDAGVVLA
jgi:hypothetical protein